MNDDDLERLLADAFDAKARAEIGDHSAPSTPRFDDPAAGVVIPHRRWTRVAAPLVASAAVLAVIVSLALVLSGSNDKQRSAAGDAVAPRPTTRSTTASKPAVPTTPVHIRLLNGDGSNYGVGMPVIAYFSRRIKNGKPLQAATTVTVNGTLARGAWFFEYSSANKGYPVEGHFRLENYWPAHSKIHVGIAAKGLSAGTGMSFDNDLTLDFTTHDRVVSTVDDTSHTMTVTDDGKKWGSFPVSLGAADTPTARGTKVIMEKGRSICMRGPGYYECGVKYTQRLTYGGEYLHAAPWNCQGSAGCIGPQNNIGSADSSNGCTNLTPTDAKKLYDFLGIGDVVVYPNANGPAMTLGAGYGDWNVNWSTWLTGGLVPA